MIEENVVRKFVDLRPSKRRIRFIGMTDRVKHRRFWPNLGMTMHTYGSCRHACERARLDALVAVTTVDAKITRVVFMAERNGLFQHEIHTGNVFTGLNERCTDSKQDDTNDNRDDDSN